MEWLLVVAGLFIIVYIAFLFWFFPVYNVWASRKNGEAELAKANFSEQIAIAEASAKLKSAHMNREADEIDALAVSNSMKIIGTALRNNEGYLRWQWIKAMADSENEKIYIPTEANLPILEAKKEAL